MIKVLGHFNNILSNIPSSSVFFVRSSFMFAQFMSHSVVGLLLARAVVISPKNGALHNSGELSFLTISHSLAHFTLGDYRR